VKITDIQVIPLFIPLDETSPVCAHPERWGHQLLVKVFTDEGIIGYGEADPFVGGAIAKFIEGQIKPRLVGENPMHVERLWDMMYHFHMGHGIRGISIYAISSVEIALWDIIGKYRNMPVYEMLGGICHHEIKAYASFLAYKKPEEVAEISIRRKDEGYTAVKIHQGADLAMESIKAVRKALGDDFTVMIDVNGAWTPQEALKMAKEMEEYNVYWLEEPIWPVDDYDALAYLKDRTSVLIAAGECEHTHYGFRELISKRAVDIVQPDAIIQGGILECKKIISMAEAWNLMVATHSFFFGPGHAANLQLSLSNMRSEYVEVNAVSPKEFYIQPSLRPENGYIKAPEKPGLGFEVDDEIIKKYSYSI